jgi:alpha-beta hydrolase superfamily lysophospholipase
MIPGGRARAVWPMGLAAALTSLLAACSSFPRVTRPPRAPPEDRVTWLEGAGGVRLYSSLQMPAGAPRAVVWFVLGPEIPSGQLYPRLTAALHDAGFATAVLHPRGTGYSEGLRGDLDDYKLFLGDYRQFLSVLSGRFASTPIFLMGHSAGAAFVLELSASAAHPLGGVILVNPAYKMIYSDGMGPSFWDYLVFGANAVFRPSALIVDMNSNPSAVKNADDRAEALAMQADPVVVRYFSMRYLFAQKEVMDRCAQNIARTTAPLLIVQGAHDALVDPKGIDELFDKARSGDKRRVVAPEGAHGSSAVETLVDPLVQWLLDAEDHRMP